jgi:hypothetical protein
VALEPKKPTAASRHTPPRIAHELNASGCEGLQPSTTDRSLGEDVRSDRRCVAQTIDNRTPLGASIEVGGVPQGSPARRTDNVLPGSPRTLRASNWASAAHWAATCFAGPAHLAGRGAIDLPGLYEHLTCEPRQHECRAGRGIGSSPSPSPISRLAAPIRNCRQAGPTRPSDRRQTNRCPGTRQDSESDRARERRPDA